MQRNWRGRWTIDEKAQKELIARKAAGETLPNPDSILPERYRKEHRSLFDNGGARIQSKTGYAQYGPFREDHTTFLMPRQNVRDVIDRSGGDVGNIETQLGLPPGSLEAPLVMVEFPTLTSAEVQMPSGNEAEANHLWLPFGHLPTGVPEAVHVDSGLPYVVTDIPLK